MFYLSILHVSVERAFEFENYFFSQAILSDNDTERCDRVCNTVLDFMALFSRFFFDEDVILCAFSAIISLLTHEKSKICMGLAMNINRP